MTYRLSALIGREVKLSDLNLLKLCFFSKIFTLLLFYVLSSETLLLWCA